MKWFIGKGADVNASTIVFGLTPLHLAVAMESEQIGLMLLEAGAIAKTDSEGRTPDMIADVIFAVQHPGMLNRIRASRVKK